MRVPRIHVVMTRSNPPPMRSVTQPPSTTFSRFDAKKTISIKTSGTMTAVAAHSGQLHRRHITKNAITAVTIMVPVTAIP